MIAKHERDLKAEKAKVNTSNPVDVRLTSHLQIAKRSIHASINASRQIVPAPIGKTAKKKSANKRKESETIEDR